MGKGKKKGGGGGGGKRAPKQPQQGAGTADAAADDDDWEALLEAESQKRPTAEGTEGDKKDDGGAAEPASGGGAAAAAEAPAAAAAADSGQDAAAAFLAAQGLDTGGGDAATKKDNKKKKKKKKGGGGGGESKADEKVSARGRLVQEQLRKQREEEERRRQAEEEEKRRIAEEEARLAEIERQKEEEKQRKKQKHKEKIERQKREGTYMTKAQKAKARQAEARLEAMRAAGMLPVEGEQQQQQKPKRVVYDNRKKGKGKGGKLQEQQQNEEPDNEEEEEEEEENKEVEDTIDAAAVVEPASSKDQEEDKKEDENNVKKDEGDDDVAAESSGDEWDAGLSDDDDEEGGAGKKGGDKFADISARLSQVRADSDDDEDLMRAEKRKEQERLRKLGLERAERERQEAEKRAAAMAQQQEEDRKKAAALQLKAEAKRKRLAKEQANLDARSPDDLRCPVVVIMGHVDTGKTKLLDKIRKTNVQEGEAGGITQQIGATYFERSTLEQQTARLNETEKVEIKVPGMLVIDTPGHESFTNLRSRGSSLCDVAILVVDLMHGLEQQTLESLKMLRKKKVPFVVALNKVDRCYNWQIRKDTPIRESLKAQYDDNTRSEFETRCTTAKVQLQEQGVNSNLYWEMGNEDWTNSDFIPLVPTSAVTGEGVQDVLLLLVQMAQRCLTEQLMWHANLQCTVLEVKAIDGLGMTVDVLVVNGYLKEGDRAVFCTLDGPVVTEIRGLLTPPPSREMRVKSEYIHHKQIKGAIGVKIIGNNLDKVMAGTPVMVVNSQEEEADVVDQVMSDLTSLEDKLSTDKLGVLVQASTLGALEALLQFLRVDTEPPIPVSAIGIGTIHKRDVTKISIMNEKGHSEYATILAFDVEVEQAARDYATEMNVRIMTANIIYHLFDQFTYFMDEFKEQQQRDAAAVAVFPCICKILPQHVFNQKNPIILGVEVAEGILKVGTPLCVPALGGLHVGVVTSIESNGREQETARKGSSVAVKIVNEGNPNLTYGRQFDSAHALYSTLSRQSIDALKAHFKDHLENEDWRLVVKLKKVFNIL